MFKDRWGGSKQIQFSCEYGDNGPDPIRCNEFMVNEGEEWDSRRIRQVFNEPNANSILECLINPIREDLQLLSSEFLDAQEMASNFVGSNTQEHWLKELHTAESAEACAFEEGVRMAIENDWTQVVFEGDSATVVSKLDRKELDRSHTAAHLRSTISKLMDHPGFSFSFVRRACNRAAHGLAQWAVNGDVIFRFDFDIPLCIEHFVIEDAIFG
ncbi:hypothetical protein V6N13_023006 [Hibiscus sabdariffa]